MKKTAVAVVAAVATSALVLSGCSGGGEAGNDADTSKATHLKIGNFLNVTSWDPANADIGFDGPYLSAVYDPLVRVDDKGNPTPALATEWEYSEDKKTLTVDLRTDVTFSDGVKFDAEAAVVGLEHLKNGTRSRDAYTAVDAISKVDDDTIEITLTKRDDSLLYLMGSGRSWMASPKAIEAETLNKEPVGSGPYTLDTANSTPGSIYNFTKVEDHWDAKTFPFEELTIQPFMDETARQNAMLAGQVNVIYGADTDLQQAKDKGWNVAAKVGNWVGIQFTDRVGEMVPALGDVRVRQAIAHAFDGAAILESISSGVGADTNQVFPADGPINDEELDGTYKQDIEKAKQLLADAGYPDGFSVTMPMSPIFQTWQAVATQGLESIGIDVTWVDMQMPDYQKKAATYPMFLAVLTIDSDPTTTVTRQVSTNTWYNPNGTRDLAAHPELQALVDEINTTDGDAQVAAIKKLNEKLVDLVWENVWYQGKNLYFSAPGITVTPVTGLMFPTLNFIQQG